MTTLADMTVQQRQDCIGMWADYRITPVVIISVYYDTYVKNWVVDVFDPIDGWMEKRIHPSCVTPRCDLPRVWNPDGTPVTKG